MKVRTILIFGFMALIAAPAIAQTAPSMTPIDPAFDKETKKLIREINTMLKQDNLSDTNSSNGSKNNQADTTTDTDKTEPAGAKNTKADKSSNDKSNDSPGAEADKSSSASESKAGSEAESPAPAKTTAERDTGPETDRSQDKRSPKEQEEQSTMLYQHIYSLGHGTAHYKPSMAHTGSVQSVLSQIMLQEWVVDVKGVDEAMQARPNQNWLVTVAKLAKNRGYYVFVNWPDRTLRIRPQPNDALMVYKGEPISVLLRRWAHRTPFDVTWEVDYDYRLKAQARFPSDFVKASQQLSSSLYRNDIPLKLDLYKKNKVLLVTKRANGGQQ